MNKSEWVSFLRMGIAGVIGGLVVVVAAVIAFELGLVKALVPRPTTGGGGSSIVKVMGGSIHGWTSDGWSDPSGGHIFQAKPKGTNGSLSTTGFKNDVTAAGGWEIVISNSDKNTEQKDAIYFCSDLNCDKGLDKQGLVYLFSVRKGVSLSQDSDTKTIRFHDDQHCDNGGGGEDPLCDKIVKAYLYTASGVDQVLDCQAAADAKAKHCEIDIGN